MDRRVITEVWLPGNGRSHDTLIKHDWGDVIDIWYEAEDFDGSPMSWFVVECKNQKTRKINPSQVTEVVWENAK